MPCIFQRTLSIFLILTKNATQKTFFVKTSGGKRWQILRKIKICCPNVLLRRHFTSWEGNELNIEKKTILLIEHLDDQPKGFFLVILENSFAPKQLNLTFRMSRAEEQKVFFFFRSFIRYGNELTEHVLNENTEGEKNVWQYRFTEKENGDEIQECVGGKTTAWCLTTWV